MAKSLIINADDLGLSIGVSRGIEEAYRSGIVSSATLMANMPGFEEGVQVALRNSNLGIGVHLNIIRGEPLLAKDKVFALLASDGKFIPNIYQIGRVAANPDYQQAAEIEYRAQIERVLDSGVKPDHLDFEKHHGIWKPLYRIACRLAAEYNLALRSYNEPLFYILQNLPFAGYNNLWQSLHLKFYHTFFHKSFTTSMPDYFFGQSHIGKIDTAFLKALIHTLPEGTSELMTHPGINYAEENSAITDYIGKSWIDNSREAELHALTDKTIIDILKKSSIKLTTFKEGLS